ncbi:uncharacterized protein [Littorina saxatilis]|uniref:uncharacterized protein n=1 Tax=Littorina saxatilis TaxID=31220 RepID=UPI0038B68D17
MKSVLAPLILAIAVTLNVQCTSLRGTCVEMCSKNSDCPFGTLCRSNGCGHTCQTHAARRSPVRLTLDSNAESSSVCPSDPSSCSLGIAHCKTNPCSISTCSVSGAQCFDNYCGGCKADWCLNGFPISC